jgi:hypothetical protein
VIFGIDPEHRHRRHLVFGGDPFGQFERGEGLEQREQRSAEQSGLLAGDDGDGPGVDELLRLLSRSRRCAASFLLRGEHRGDIAALACMTLGGGDRARPRRRIGGIASKKWRDGPEIEGVVGRETPDPGEAAEIHRNPRRRLVARGKTVFS